VIAAIAAIAVAAVATAVTACSAAPAASVRDMAAAHSAAKTSAAQTSAAHSAAQTSAAHSAAQTSAARAGAAVRRGLLREFLTVHNQGYFYTAYPPEARSVVRKFHFHATGRTFGYVDALRSGPGRIPMWRLDNGPHPLWRVATTAQERRLRRHGWHLDGLIGFMFSKR